MTRDDVLKIVNEARKKREVPNLSGSDLSYCDLRGSDLHGCNLRGSDLRYSNLSGSDLRYCNLSGSDLRYCNLDFSCLPLWCGTKGVKVDIKIVRQLLAHVAVLECDDPAFKKIRKAILPEAKKCHRAKELGLLDETKTKGKE